MVSSRNGQRLPRFDVCEMLRRPPNWRHVHDAAVVHPRIRRSSMPWPFNHNVRDFQEHWPDGAVTVPPLDVVKQCVVHVFRLGLGPVSIRCSVVLYARYAVAIAANESI